MNRKRRPTRGILIGRFVLAIVLLGVLFAPGLSTRAQQLGESPAFGPLAPPADVTAQSVFVEDVTAETPLYAANPNERWSPASTTKLMTALVIARHTTDWQEYVVADPSDVLSVDDGESMIGLLDGDMLTVEQMMYGLMLNSGNDAAHAMARFIGSKLLVEEGAEGDPVERFVQEMNAVVGELGLQNTHFTNAAGLYGDDHYTSARDLAVIAAQAYAVPQILDASSTDYYEFYSAGSNPRNFFLENTNKLLGQDGVIAGKTGTLMQSLACLVVVRREGPNMVVGVILGSDIDFDADLIQIADTDRRFSDMHSILTAMDRDYRWLQPNDDLPGLDQELDVWGVQLDTTSAIVLPADQANDPRYLLKLGPPSPPNDPAGTLLIFDESQLVAERTVIQRDSF